MSTVLTRRRSGPARSRDHRQTSLFSQVVAPAPRTDDAMIEIPAPVRDAVADRSAVDTAPATDTTRTRASGLTLEEMITGLWGDLTAGEPADCPVCGSAMESRHSAGTGVDGGRCSGCGTTIV